MLVRRDDARRHRSRPAAGTLHGPDPADLWRVADVPG